MLKTDLILQALTEAMDSTEPELLSHVLSALKSLLSIGDIEECNPQVIDLHVVGGLDKLELLLRHENSVVSNKAKEIMNKYFYIPTTVEYQLEEKEINEKKTTDK